MSAAPAPDSPDPTDPRLLVREAVRTGWDVYTCPGCGNGDHGQITGTGNGADLLLTCRVRAWRAAPDGTSVFSECGMSWYPEDMRAGEQGADRV